MPLLLLACSSESDGQNGEPEPELEGALCVDANDACCCDEESLYVENGPACTIHFAGDLSRLTFELVTQSGSSVLERVPSAAECSPDGGWFTSSESAMMSVIELCPATCGVRQNEPTRLRVLSGCPLTQC